MIFEVCVDNVRSAVSAVRGGANRIELCSALCLGGLTPSLGLFTTVRKLLPSECKIFVMIRPKPGDDFVHGQEEVAVMLEDINIFKKNLADGFVFGCLTGEKAVDVDACKRLLEAAKGFPCTFHRAFDVVADPEKAFIVIENMGFARILTSGHEKDAYSGRNFIKKLVLRVNELKSPLIIVAGGGISLNNLSDILKTTGVKEFHGSARTKKFRGNSQIDEFDWETDESVVREMVQIAKMEPEVSL